MDPISIRPNTGYLAKCRKCISDIRLNILADSFYPCNNDRDPSCDRLDPYPT